MPKKRGVGVQRRINQPVETLPTTISKVRWWENFTLWGQRIWGLPKLSEQNRSDRVLLSNSDVKSSSASDACAPDKVCLMSLKWVNQRGCRWGLDDECSLAPRLASSQPSTARLNPFTLTSVTSSCSAGPWCPYTTHFLFWLSYMYMTVSLNLPLTCTLFRWHMWNKSLCVLIKAIVFSRQHAFFKKTRLCFPALITAADILKLPTGHELFGQMPPLCFCFVVQSSHPWIRPAVCKWELLLLD